MTYEKQFISKTYAGWNDGKNPINKSKDFKQNNSSDDRYTKIYSYGGFIQTIVYLKDGTYYGVQYAFPTDQINEINLEKDTTGIYDYYTLLEDGSYIEIWGINNNDATYSQVTSFSTTATKYTNCPDILVSGTDLATRAITFCGLVTGELSLINQVSNTTKLIDISADFAEVTGLFYTKTSGNIMVIGNRDDAGTLRGRIRIYNQDLNLLASKDYTNKFIHKPTHINAGASYERIAQPFFNGGANGYGIHLIDVANLSILDTITRTEELDETTAPITPLNENQEEDADNYLAFCVDEVINGPKLYIYNVTGAAFDTLNYVNEKTLLENTTIIPKIYQNGTKVCYVDGTQVKALNPKTNTDLWYCNLDETQIKNKYYPIQIYKDNLMVYGFKGSYTYAYFIEDFGNESRNINLNIEKTAYPDRNTSLDIDFKTQDSRNTSLDIEKTAYLDRNLNLDIAPYETTAYLDTSLNLNINYMNYTDRNINLNIGTAGQDDFNISLDIQKENRIDRSTNLKVEILENKDTYLNLDIQKSLDIDRGTNLNISFGNEISRSTNLDIIKQNWVNRQISLDIDPTKNESRELTLDIEQTQKDDIEANLNVEKISYIYKNVLLDVKKPEGEVRIHLDVEKPTGTGKKTEYQNDFDEILNDRI